ncbi:Hsp20/alpha crystallin family protein [Candidatus Sumerlaeota bacterium]|nr:Hsp20/alpha crystallin family protein [Candidatus Sumerlaeota bacterium]
MAIIRWRPKREWDPLGDILDLKDNLNKMINTSLRKTGDLSASFPNVDIYKQGEDYILKSELPGITKDDIDITIQDNVITLKGTKKEEKEVNEEDYYHCERLFGSFQRSFELPSVIDRKKVKATYKDGVLEVTIPLAEEAKPQQIKIDIQ